MPELVLFRDILEDDSEPQYGILMDTDEPEVICLDCGSTIEFGDYEILKRLPWENLSEYLKEKHKGD